jgi:thymidine kinase/deoxynucleoside kinase
MSIISIEGNIGVGKSTFIEKVLINNFDNCEKVSEPVEIWKTLTDENDKNILELFYNDKKRWAYSFQNIACITRMMKIEEMIRTNDKKYIFLDRSLGTDYNVFEKMLYDSGEISEIEHKMYNLWCSFYTNYVRDNNKIIYIYLKCDPKISLERINKRNRTEEKLITIDYLEKLNEYHDKWLLNLEDNIIILDCNDDFENNLEKQAEMVTAIKDKLNYK